MRKRKLLALLLSAMLTLGLAPPAGAYTSASSSVPNTIDFGEEHSGLIDASGWLWMWGNNESGEVGDGTTNIRYTPTKIMENVTSVALGWGFSAAIKCDGSLWMWGCNTCGGLGDGTTNDRYAPIKIMENASAVALGNGHAAAIKGDGSLWMWGWNCNGQVGDGTTSDRNKPVKIMENVSAVDCGGSFTAAIKTDGSLWMWGSNEFGEVGDGTITDRYTPTKITDNVTDVSCGVHHSAAIKTDGSLWMWGNYQYAPIKIMENVSDVALGHNYSAAIKRDGSLWMWGDNSIARLGDGNAPTKVMDNVSAVIFGGSHSAVIKSDDSIWVWGHNDYGQLGIGEGRGNNYNTKIPYQDAPIQLTGLKAKLPESIKVEQCTVKLNLTSGSGLTTIQCDKNGLLTPPTNPARVGYYFSGWYKDSACAKPWNFDVDKVTSDCTLYAKWTPKTTTSTIAEPSKQEVYIDGKLLTFNTYILRDAQGNNVNFVKLRDVAYVLNGTPAQFNVDWRNGAIRLDSKKPYSTPNGGEMTVPSVVSAPTKTCVTPVLTGGITAPLEAFRLTDAKGGDHNYFKLRDIGIVAGFSVTWDNEKSCIVITTTEPYKG